MKSALVTGSNGFIGKNLIKRLNQEKIKVIEFSRQRGKEMTRIKDFEDLPKVDVVFHLAAVSGYKDCNDDPALAYQVNIGGTVNVLEYCRRSGAKLIFPSTYVYDAPYDVYKKETDPVKPMTHYAFTKWLGGELCRFYSRVFEVNTLILRTVNVYGSGQSEIYLIPIIADHLKNGRPLPLTRPDIERCFIHVDDLVEAYFRLALADTKPGEVFNISLGQATAIADLIALVEKVTGKKLKVTYSGQGRPNEISINRMDNSKIKRFARWQPKISLEEGLKKLQRSHYF